MAAPPVAAVVACLLPALGFAPPGTSSTDTHHAQAECRAWAPDEPECSFVIAPPGAIELMIPIAVAFSGTLVVKAVQDGVAVWNGSCIIPLGFTDTGVGHCMGEEGIRYRLNEAVTMRVQVGVYGVGTYGLRATY